MLGMSMGLFLLASCVSLNGQKTAIINNGGGIYTYPSTEDDSETPFTMAGFSGKLFFSDGCVLLYDGKEVMTPIFPDKNTFFDKKNHTLTISGVKFEMGDRIYSGGWIGSSEEYITSINLNPKQDHNCLQDKVNYFRGIPENLSNKTS